jgi:ATP-binding cassette, subfamily C (CFTR/MRP), member 1
MVTAGYISQLISPVLTFAIFIAIANSQNLVLDTATMFTSLSFLMLISAPLNIVFQSVPGFMSTIVCFGRIEKFIDTEKWSNGARKSPGSEKSLLEKPSSTDAIEIASGTYGWAKDGKPVLENVNSKIPRGKLTFVIGRVGCGKSTLLKALLGEVTLAEGNINKPLESVAFCDQTPWILNGTFKENVCMFSNKEDPYYDTVLHACGLHDDLKQLPDGDRSSLGSKGITLSGGQKQRLVSQRTDREGILRY